MADISIDDIKEFLDATGQSIDNITNYGEALDALREGIRNFGPQAKSLGLDIRDIGDYAGVLMDHLKKLKDDASLTEFAAGFKAKLEEIKIGLQGFGVSAADIGVTLTNLITTVRRATTNFGTFDNLSQGAKGTTAQITELTERFKGLSDSQKARFGISDQFIAVAEHMGKLRDASINMQNAFLQNQAAAGKLGGAVGELGDRFPDLNLRIEEFNSLTSEVGNIVGLTSQEVGQYFMQLDKIPGTLEDNIRVHKDGVESVSELEAALLVARGTHQDYGVVIGQVDTMMSEFGLSTEESLQSISKMFSVTQSVGLKMNEVASFTTNAGNAFKFLGDTADSAQNNIAGSLAVLKELTPALKDAGLGADAATDLVERFVSGLAGMSTAQQAFLSGQTGGPGGLLGALEIEQSLSEGGLADVAGRVQQALRDQVGGELITREQAIQRGEAGAQQFEFQRQLLMQGPFGNLAQDPQQASALIEALQKGDLTAIEEMQATGQQDLEAVVKDGNSIAQEQTSILTRISNQISEFANQNIMTSGQTVRGFDQFTQQQAEENLPGLFRSDAEESVISRQRVTGLTDPRAKEGEFDTSAQKIISGGKSILEAFGLDKAFNDLVDRFGPKNQAQEEPDFGLDLFNGLTLGVPTGSDRPSPLSAVSPGVESNAQRVAIATPTATATGQAGGAAGQMDKLDITITVETQEGAVLGIVDKRYKQYKDGRQTQISTGAFSLG
jgi:hypothetical protein